MKKKWLIIAFVIIVLLGGILFFLFRQEPQYIRLGDDQISSPSKLFGREIKASSKEIDDTTQTYYFEEEMKGTIRLYKYLLIERDDFEVLSNGEVNSNTLVKEATESGKILKVVLHTESPHCYVRYSKEVGTMPEKEPEEEGIRESEEALDLNFDKEEYFFEEDEDKR